MEANKQHKKCGIYCIRNLVNNKVYIGKSIDIYKRIKSHIWMLNTEDSSCNDYLLRSWKKYGKENFEYFVLEFLDVNDILLKERELYWMNQYDSLDHSKGYNLRSDSESNMVVHQLTSKKISDRLKKRMAGR